MSNGKATRTVIVTSPQGIHARPADLFAALANRYRATIEVVKDGERVDAKSMLNILTLAATNGTRLEIQAEGDDAEAALAALAELVEKNFDEEFATENKPTS